MENSIKYKNQIRINHLNELIAKLKSEQILPDEFHYELIKRNEEPYLTIERNSENLRNNRYCLELDSEEKKILKGIKNTESIFFYFNNAQRNKKYKLENDEQSDL